MTIKKDKDIELLIGRFLDGETTNAEEQRLYDYFAGTRVASRLEKYRPMFSWYAGGMEEPLPESAPTAVPRVRLIPLWLRTAACAAAAVLLIAGAAVAYLRHASAERLYATYEGSYIVRGGKKITDLKAIMPELRRIEREASALACRHKGIGSMKPREIFKMMEDANKQNDNRPTI